MTVHGGRKEIAKLTQTEKAYAALKKGILQADIEEGVFLSESEIMRRYRIGRTPYREACNRLHHEGLLEVVPRRGYLIPEVSFQSVCDIFETRLVLEGAIAELAAVRANDQDVQELDRLVNEPLSAKAPAAVIQANADFHLRLAKIARNQELVELLTHNLEKTERLMYIELRSSRFRQTELKTFHGRIVEALRTRDPQRVREVVLSDIIEAQQATLTFSKNAAVSTLVTVINGAAAWQPPAQGPDQAFAERKSSDSRQEEES
jgi:DNA-binding GntR family transcriptional regulator